MEAALDSTYVKVHRSAHGGKGRAGTSHRSVAGWAAGGRPPHAGNVSDVKAAPDVLAAAPGRLKRLFTDRGYNANHLRRDLKAACTTPVISGTRSRKCPIQHDERRCRDRWRIEAAFCRLGDFRRVATRLPQARGQLRFSRGAGCHHRASDPDRVQTLAKV